MKKIITVLCAAVMALSLFAGCGQKANDNGTTAAGGTVATDGSTSMEKVIAIAATSSAAYSLNLKEYICPL